MADILFFIAGFAFASLIGANLLLIVAKVTHHEKLAKQVVAAASRVIWIFKLGGEDNPHLNNSADGSLRV